MYLDLNFFFLLHLWVLLLFLFIFQGLFSLFLGENWQMSEKYGRRISFRIIAIVSFTFFYSWFFWFVFVVTSSFTLFFFIYSVSSFSITFSCLIVSRFPFPFEFYIFIRVYLWFNNTRDLIILWLEIALVICHYRLLSITMVKPIYLIHYTKKYRSIKKCN